MTIPFTISTDKVGFPIVETAALPFSVLWLPVTKVQFEHFLVDSGCYDDDWYQKILQQYGGRASVGHVNASNYWQLFMTGILPIEIRQYAEWCGYGFDLPTSEQWKQALHYFAQWKADPTFLDAVLQASHLNERARLMLRKADNILQEENRQINGERLLCDQMVMRLGVMEFTYESNQRSSFCCWGQPSRGLFGMAHNPLRDTTPMRLIDRANGTRTRYCGFRLIRSK